jgi:molybdate transport system ATP-binding protein
MGTLHLDCRFRYDSGFALDASFEAGDGITALFGPSGSGKTTILALAAGILRPLSGTIRLGDRVVADTASGVFVPPERRRIGVVFQEHRLFPHLTVRHNLRFGLGRYAARSVDFARLVEVLEIGELLDRLPAALSGGQRQRVALGRALLCGPEMLLMDEPLAALDAGLKERILSYLDRALAEWSIPTLFVSHDQADVRRLADRVVVIEAGRIIACGGIAETLDRTLPERPPHRTVPMNLLQVTDLLEVDGHWQGKMAGQTLRLPPSDLRAGDSACVQFEPHDVILTRELQTGGGSTRNRIEGVVRAVLILPGRTCVALDVGQFLWAEVTREAARDLNLREGDAVTCLIEPNCIKIVGTVPSAKA